MCQVVGIRGENSTLAPAASARLGCSFRVVHIIPENIKAPAILTSLPDELTIFHVVIASG